MNFPIRKFLLTPTRKALEDAPARSSWGWSQMRTVMHSDIRNTPAQKCRYNVAWSVALALGLVSPLAAAADEDSVQEVLVTAQRRTQNIMDVPLSVTSYSPEQL